MRNRVMSFLFKNQLLLVLFLIAVVFLAYQILSTLIALFSSYILMATLAPYADYLKKKKFPNIIAVLIPYSIFLAFLLLLIIPLLPFFLKQISELFRQLSLFLSKDNSFVAFNVGIEQINSFIASQLGNISKNALQLTGVVFSSIFTLITVFVVGFYLLLYRQDFKRGITQLFPEGARTDVLRTLDHVDEKLGAWMQGQIVLSFFIGVITYVVLSILHIEFALSLALIAALLEIVPSIGPTIAAIPAIIIALNTSLPLAIIVTIVYVVIQQLENNILVPRIMERAVGLNPIVIIVAIIVGGRLLGVAGALLAIPFVSLCIVLYHSINKNFTKLSSGK